MKKRILFIEDNPRPMELADLLVSQGYSVTKCFTLSDAESCLTGETPGGPFDMIFLDLTMNAYDLPPKFKDEAKKCGLAGWVFYKYVVPIYAPELCGKTVFYTAYEGNLKDKLTSDEFEKLNILPKKGEDLQKKALEYIKKLS